MYGPVIKNWGDIPIINGEIPIKNGDFPIKTGDFPIKHGDFPIKNGDIQPFSTEPWLWKKEGPTNITLIAFLSPIFLDPCFPRGFIQQCVFEQNS